jgi:hypothetical protein
MAVLPTGIGPVTGYNIERSLRFNSADSAGLNRTAGTPTSNSAWTYSVWLKRGLISTGANLYVMRAQNPGNTLSTELFVATNDIIFFREYGPSAYTSYLETTQKLRDPAAWYHIVLAYNPSNGTSSDKVRLYINGVRVTAFLTTIYPSSTSQATAWNTSGNPQYIGSTNTSTFDGYMTEINFIDGQGNLTQNDFGETDSATGVWKPKKYGGTYGNNGFYLKFADNSGTTSTTLGKDYSGNGNNWTPNNFSVTAGAGNDSMVDSPTSYGTDTGAGGEVRGNYCTLNPIVTGNVITPLNGNLNTSLAASSNAYFSTVGTTAVSSGKWYWECTVTARDASAGQWMQFGIVATTTTYTSNALGFSGNMSNGYAYYNDGAKAGQGTSTAGYGATFTTNDVIGIALDLDAGTITFYKNGVSQGQAYSGISLTTSWLPIIQMYRSTGTTQSAFINFGQRPFEKWNGSAYVANTAPSGFKALCTQNLPPVTIGATSTTQANDYFNAVLWTGNASSPRAITGVGFQPDLLWIKSRSNAYDNLLMDAVRGTGNLKWISSNLTDAEGTNFNNANVTSLDSDGFTIGTTGGTNILNANTVTNVAWNWNAGGSNQTISVGQYATSPANVPSIASTVRANTTSKFSIVTYTGNGTNGATVGHGLGTTPAMVIIKSRSLTGTTPSASWIVWHRSISQAIQTDTTIALTGFTGATVLNSTAQSTTYGFDAQVNGSTQTYVAYCFAPVDGYSAFGSYTGNGAADGPFVYTGFRPAFVMVKNTVSAATSNWIMKDKLRAANYNPATGNQYANLAFADDVTATVEIDLLSNGFKIRGTYAGINGSTNSIIYMAFAENPFKYSLAR